MQIYLMEDSLVEFDKAVAAIQAAGHEPLRSRGPDNEIRNFYAEFAGAFQAGVRNAYEISEVSLARCDGVITDLMFDPTRKKHAEEYEPGEIPHPAGLLVVIQALLLNKPVVICTDAYGNHHGTEVGWMYDTLFNRLLVGTSPFLESKLPKRVGWVDTKDWNLAIKRLEELQRVIGAG